MSSQKDIFNKKINPAINSPQSSIVDQHISFTDKQNTKINNSVIDFTEKLLEKNQSGSYYTEKRNANSDRLFDNIAIGKKAEFFAAYYLYKVFEYPMIPIDIDIRDGMSKQWICDLPYSEYDKDLRNTHVKVCDKKTIEYVGDYSWTFQWSNNQKNTGGKDELFKKENQNDLIILLYMENFQTNQAVIKFFGSFNQIVDLLKDPLSKKLFGLKKCLYFDDIKEHFIYLDDYLSRQS